MTSIRGRQPTRARSCIRRDGLQIAPPDRTMLGETTSRLTWSKRLAEADARWKVELALE
jgi:hypothetical protein